MTEPVQHVQDLDAEASVLSAILLDPDRISEVERVLAPADFFADCNRHVAQAIWDLDSASEAVDVTSVASRLNATDRLARVGGTPYLAQLIGSTPAVAHVEDHARIVAAAARIRRVQALCRTLTAEGYAALGHAADWLQDVEARVFAATDALTMRPETIALLGPAVGVEFQELQDRKAGKRETAGRRTRIPAIDRILHGLVDGVPYVVAGRPGHGKTAIGWQIADGISRDGSLVAFLSQEMPKAQLVQRALCQDANVEPERFRSGQLSDDEWNAVADATARLARLPVAIDDRAGHTVHSARSSVRRCVQKLRAAGHQGKLGLVVLDYLQIMGGERQRGDSRATEVADNMHGMTRLAKEFGCPVLILSQLNREIDKRPDKRPKLSDLGESGAIEADAYGVVFVYREDMYRDEREHNGEAEIIVAKHRNGRSGSVTMRYMPSTLFAGVNDDLHDSFDQLDPASGGDWHP